EAIEEVLCFASRGGSTSMCERAESSGSRAFFEHSETPVGHQLTIAVGWPAGTFSDIDPILVKRPRIANPVNPASPAGLLGVLVALGGIGGVMTVLGRRGRDDAYLGLTPGLSPGLGQEAPVGKRSMRDPVAVQFQP